jgi:hypothetical protein
MNLRRNDNGFITMIVVLILILALALYFVFTRVKSAQT